jgi:heptosyltransferase-2
MNTPNRILIVRTDRLGDVILSTPVIKNLRNFYPASYIAFMCRPYTAQILQNNPYLNEIIIYDKYTKHKSIISSFKFSRALAKKKFDIAFILNPTKRANIITFLAKIPVRVGLKRKFGKLLTHPIEDTKHEGKKHELEYTLDIIRKMGVAAPEKKTYFPLKDDSEKRIENLLKENGIKNNDFIVIHPSASCPSKRWPEMHFIKLINLLKQNFKFKIILIGSENEKKYSENIVQEPDILDLRGKLDISDTGSLLKRAKLFISNDSGPVHIAASFDTPVISIFGRKDPGLSPERWKPLGEKSFYIHKGYNCEVCLAHNCKIGFMCLKAISPEEVFELAGTIITDH